jgi:hypothetical protein
MDTRAAKAVYAGTREVRPPEYAMLLRIAHCQRVPANKAKARKFNTSQRHSWKLRRYQKYLDLHMSLAIASYYDTHGIGACNNSGGDVQIGYRFASLFLACGTRVKFCHRNICAIGIMSDHGPYVGGRLFDLNVNLKYLLRCGGICTLRWRLY